MAIITRTKPTPRVTLPHQSTAARLRIPRSWSSVSDQIVPNNPNGTDTKYTRRQLIAARPPPSTGPMNRPAMLDTLLIPSANPRWVAGNASVMMAPDLAAVDASPMPCMTRPRIR